MNYIYESHEATVYDPVKHKKEVTYWWAVGHLQRKNGLTYCGRNLDRFIVYEERIRARKLCQKCAFVADVEV